MTSNSLVERSAKILYHTGYAVIREIQVVLRSLPGKVWADWVRTVGCLQFCKKSLNKHTGPWGLKGVTVSQFPEKSIYLFR